MLKGLKLTSIFLLSTVLHVCAMEDSVRERNQQIYKKNEHKINQLIIPKTLKRKGKPSLEADNAKKSRLEGPEKIVVTTPLTLPEASLKPFDDLEGREDNGSFAHADNVVILQERINSLESLRIQLLIENSFLVQKLNHYRLYETQTPAEGESVTSGLPVQPANTKKRKSYFLPWSEVYGVLGNALEGFLPHDSTVFKFDKKSGGFWHIKDHLQGKNKYIDILKGIVKESSESLKNRGAILSSNTISISQGYINHHLSLIDEYYHGVDHKQENLQDLLELRQVAIRLLALRLVQEMRNEQTSFPYRNNSEIHTDFFKLCAYTGGYKACEANKMELRGNSSRRSLEGMSCSGYFMDKDRLNVQKTSNNHFKKSPEEIFKSFALVGYVASDIKKRLKDKWKQYPYPQENPSKIHCLTRSSLRLKLTRGVGAGQFRPTFVMDVLSFCKANAISVSKVADFSCGWGDRLVGYLGAAQRYGITQYLGTDPNVNLHKKYLSICSTFTPLNYAPCQESVETNEYIEAVYKAVDPNEGHFTVRIYKKPVEDLNQEELCLQNQPADLMLASIPYHGKERYPDTNQTQSYVRYKEYEMWKTHFLHEFVNQSVKAVRNGGVIAINSAAINKGESSGLIDIPHDLEVYMNSFNQGNVTLSRVGNLLYDGMPVSSTLMYQVHKKVASFSFNPML